MHYDDFIEADLTFTSLIQEHGHSEDSLFKALDNLYTDSSNVDCYAYRNKISERFQYAVTECNLHEVKAFIRFFIKYQFSLSNKDILCFHVTISDMTENYFHVRKISLSSINPDIPELLSLFVDPSNPFLKFNLKFRETINFIKSYIDNIFHYEDYQVVNFLFSNNKVNAYFYENDREWFLKLDQPEVSNIQSFLLSKKLNKF